MKKRWSKVLCLVLVFALFALFALGSGSDNGSETKAISDKGKETQEAAPGTDAQKEEPKKEDPKKEETKKAEPEKVSIEETVLIDRDGIKVTAKEYVTDTIWGDGIKLLIENNTDRNVTVGCRALIVNNYMIPDLFVSTVAAGKKSNETLDLSSSALKAAGIDTVGQIEAYFHVYDADSWEDLFDTDLVTIKTSAYDHMDVTPNDAGKELYAGDGIRIVGKYVDEDSFWGAGILLYIENNSGKNVTIQCDDFSVNGFMITPYFSCTVYDGKMAIDDITLMSSELEENNIESVDEVALKFEIIDEKTYQTITQTDEIVFTAK